MATNPFAISGFDDVGFQKSFERGTASRLGNERRALLSDVGQRLATGDAGGAADAAFQGGDIGTGLALDAKQTADEKRRLENVATALLGANDERAFTSALSGLETRQGLPAGTLSGRFRFADKSSILNEVRGARAILAQQDRERITPLQKRNLALKETEATRLAGQDAAFSRLVTGGPAGEAPVAAGAVTLAETDPAAIPIGGGRPALTPTPRAEAASAGGLFSGLTQEESAAVQVLAADRKTRADAIKLANDFRKQRQKQATVTEKADLGALESGVTGQNIITSLDRGLELVTESPFFTTGLTGQVLSNIGGTEARDLDALLDTARAGVSFAALSRMRKASPTGGALGNVTVRELELLASTIANLEQSQTADQLTENMKRVKNQYLDTIHGEGEGPPREVIGEAERGPALVPPPSESGPARPRITADVNEENIQDTMRLRGMTRQEVLDEVQRRIRGQ